MSDVGCRISGDTVGRRKLWLSTGNHPKSDIRHPTSEIRHPLTTGNRLAGRLYNKKWVTMNDTLRVLIVDDEASQRAGLAGMVNAWGMLPDTASDGAEALEKLSRVPADVILTDLNMPGMDGFALLDKLKSMGDSPPTIVLTAYGS